ncbi:MAG: Gx transporter family protein [Endomicrobiales bacterium]|jgi:heptaprenyl diphosphate synthase
MNNDILFRKISLLAACACVLQIMESFIPLPFPGIKLGLANLITLITLVTIGFQASLYVSIIRIVMSSFILGSFLSPTFILSFTGGLVSTLAMGLFFVLNKKSQFLSLIGISIIGALVHNVTQLSLVFLFFQGNRGILWLVPWLGFSAIVMGYVTGLVASRVLKKMENISHQTQYSSREKSLHCEHMRPQQTPLPSSVVSRLPGMFKIVLFLGCVTFVMITHNFYCLGMLLCVAAATMMCAGISPVLLVSRLKKISLLLVFSFIFNVLFSRGGNVLYQVGFIVVTSRGLEAGALVCSRLILFIVCAFIIIKTTPADELMRVLKKLISPLIFLGCNTEQLINRIELSWRSMPFLWNRMQSMIRPARKAGNKIGFKYAISAATRAIVAIMMHVESEAAHGVSRK